MRSDGIGGSWAKRDAVVVWHGVTQLSCCTESDPVVVMASDGHDLIDVDGRRDLDAISSRWVNTLGHHLAELDDTIREQLERGARSTRLGNGNQIVVELAGALAPGGHGVHWPATATRSTWCAGSNPISSCWSPILASGRSTRSAWPRRRSTHRRRSSWSSTASTPLMPSIGPTGHG